MSGQGTDVTHQQAHANALQDIWNPHAALRLPKMHELPPLDTQLIPASLARAFGIQLTHGDDDTEQAGLQQERGPQAEVQQGSQQMQQLQQAQQLQLAHQLQQAGMQQGQTPYAAYPFGMEAMDRQAFAQQHAGYPTKQGFNPVLVGSMPPGNAAYGAYMQPGMFDPRDAMAAGYGLGQFQGSFQQPLQQQLQEQLQPQQQQQQAAQQQQQQQKQQPSTTQGWQEQGNGAAALAQPMQRQQQQQQPAAPEEPPTPSAGAGDDGEDTGARALKRPRLVWTPKLHQCFVEAVEQLGLKSAVPKTIMQLMNVEGLTRENVASHLQKFRVQQKKDARADGNAAGDAPAAVPAQQRLVSGGTGTGGGTGESVGPHSNEGPDLAGAQNGGTSKDPADKAAGLVANNMQQSRAPGVLGASSALQIKAEDARAVDGRAQATAAPTRQP